MIIMTEFKQWEWEWSFGKCRNVVKQLEVDKTLWRKLVENKQDQGSSKRTKMCSESCYYSLIFFIVIKIRQH